MQFVVDRVSEDSFYSNLLLGLPEVLKQLGIDCIILDRFTGLSECDILQWEIKHGVRLPEDIREFYSACNGFQYSWYLTTTENEDDEKELAGRINVNPLNKITQMFGYETKNKFDVEVIDNRYVLNLGMESKLFVLDTLEGIGRIVLVYLKLKYLPTIWLCTKKMEFYFLADDFTTYLRMAVAHLGIPEWQFSFTPYPVSETSLELFQIFIPHVLPMHDKSEQLFDFKTTDDEYPEVPLNIIDSDSVLCPSKPAQTTVPTKLVNLHTSTSGKKHSDKKKQQKNKPQTKFKRKPLYYVK